MKNFLRFAREGPEDGRKLFWKRSRLKSQMKYADKIGAAHTLILGSSELENGRGVLRRMADGEQREVGFSDAETLAKELLG